jgi:hypothetical protein
LITTSILSAPKIISKEYHSLKSIEIDWDARTVPELGSIISTVSGSIENFTSISSSSLEFLSIKLEAPGGITSLAISSYIE